MYQKNFFMILITAFLAFCLFLFPNHLSAYYSSPYSPPGRIFYGDFYGYGGINNVGINNSLYGYTPNPLINSVSLLTPYNFSRLAAEVSSTPQFQPFTISLADLAGTWIGNWLATTSTKQISPQGNIAIDFIENFVNGHVSAFIVFEQNALLNRGITVYGTIAKEQVTLVGEFQTVLSPKPLTLEIFCTVDLPNNITGAYQISQYQGGAANNIYERGIFEVTYLPPLPIITPAIPPLIGAPLPLPTIPPIPTAAIPVALPPSYLVPIFASVTAPAPEQTLLIPDTVTPPPPVTIPPSAVVFPIASPTIIPSTQIIEPITAQVIAPANNPSILAPPPIIPFTLPSIFFPYNPLFLLPATISSPTLLPPSPILPIFPITPYFPSFETISLPSPITSLFHLLYTE